MLESIQRRGGTRRDGMRIEGSWRERLEQRWQNWIRGAVHDVALRDAGFEGFVSVLWMVWLGVDVSQISFLHRSVSS